MKVSEDEAAEEKEEKKKKASLILALQKAFNDTATSNPLPPH